MKARIPREYESLNPAQKERLKQYCIDVAAEAALKQEEHDCRVILDLYMKQACCILHDAFGFGEKRLTYFIANHKRMFDRQNRLVVKGGQTKYLNARMAEIFKKEGFPQEFLDGLIERIDIIDAPPKENEKHG
jgi:hypothetical protein